MARRPNSLIPQLQCLWQSVDALGDATGGVVQGPKGDKGDKGDPGENGVDGIDGVPGHDGLPGAKGDTGERGETGLQGPVGNDGNDGADGASGADGPSAYAVAVANGFAGTQAQWLASLVGAKGDKGDTGNTGATGNAGAAGSNGSDGNDGAPGASAYQVAVSQGYGGNVTAWLASLVGAKGDKGDTGSQGIQGIQGVAGTDGVRTATTAFGYSTGAGGTVSQSGNKSSAVTLNKLTGEITMTTTALAAATIVTFVLNNSTLAAGDQLLCTHHATGTFGAYTVNGRVTGAGAGAISIRNNSASSLGEAIVIKFTVIKAVNA